MPLYLSGQRRFLIALPGQVILQGSAGAAPHYFGYVVGRLGAGIDPRPAFDVEDSR